VTATVTEVLPTPASVHWGYQDGTRAPVTHIADGGHVRVRTVQGRLTDPVPPDWLADDVRAIIASDTPRGPGPHIVTGPVAVEGARPGDVVAVDILAIRLGARYGINRMRTGTGLFPDALPPGSEPDVVAIPVDPATGTGRVPPGIDVRLRPFFGIVATAPDPAWGRVSTVEPRANGGNMDCRELTAGTRLFLPVFVPGANVSVGDGHAAQGDGEIDQTAIETCLEGDLAIAVQPGLTLDRPLAVTPAGLVAMGFDATLDAAARTAVDDLLRFLDRYCGLPWLAGYRLASLAVDLRVTQVVNREVGVHAVLPHDVLAQLDTPDWLRTPDVAADHGAPGGASPRTGAPGVPATDLRGSPWR
jgi:acetamidase/formamidase